RGRAVNRAQALYCLLDKRRRANVQVGTGAVLVLIRLYHLRVEQKTLRQLRDAGGDKLEHAEPLMAEPDDALPVSDVNTDGVPAPVLSQYQVCPEPLILRLVRIGGYAVRGGDRPEPRSDAVEAETRGGVLREPRFRQEAQGRKGKGRRLPPRCQSDQF